MKLIKLTTPLLLIFFYLAFSYVRFYHTIGDVNLKSPYADKTLALENAAQKGSVKYVALGDSLSAGVGSADIKETIVYLHALKLSEKYEKVNVLNLARSGDTTTEVIRNQLPQAIEEKPDHTTLLIGINDIHNKRTLADFRNNYQLILNELLTRTSAKITVINIPYLDSRKTAYFPFNYLLNFRTTQFNKIISSLVAEINSSDRIRLVDLYGQTLAISKQSSAYYAADLFHPSAEGYLIWGEIINAR